MPAERALITFDQIFPRSSAYVISARLDYGDTAWLEYEESRLDLMAASFRLYSEDIPVLCHAACASPLVLDFMRDCGHAPGAKLLTYRSRAEHHARRLWRWCTGGGPAGPCAPLPAGPS